MNQYSLGIQTLIILRISMVKPVLRLKDLDGRIIDKPGWYDFTLRETEDTVYDPDLDLFVPAWRDGGRYLYGDYYTNDYGIDDEGNPEIEAGSWRVTSNVSSDDELPEQMLFRRLIGLELIFTDNKFGDKDVQLNRIVDPFGTGATDGGSSRFTSNFTSDFVWRWTTLRGEEVLPGFKQVPFSAQVVALWFQAGTD